MKKPIQLLDVVALTEDVADRGLFRGQVGTVVESLAPQVFEVKFSDDEGAPTPPWPSAPTNSCRSTIVLSRPLEQSRLALDALAGLPRKRSILKFWFSSFVFS